MRPVAVTGVGYTELSKRSERSVLDLATEACRGAVADAGAKLPEVDGVLSFSVANDSVPSEAVATTLALPGLRFVMDFHQGGQSPCFMVQLATMAVAQGYADSVLVFRALNGRSGTRVGHAALRGGGGQFRYPIGYGAYLMNIAMWARRYLYETGQGAEELAAVAIAQRAYAQLNERAIVRQPLDLETYLAAPMVAEPFRAPDCTSEVDGACAVLVTSLERARDLLWPPAVVRSAAYRAGARPGLDIGDQLLFDDYTRNFTGLLREELFGRAGITPADVDFAQIYDCFTSTVLFGLEGLGFCGRGEAGAFVRSGATALNGSLPTNTNGGLLAEGYLHGMNSVAEAVLQVQGRCGQRQVPRHEVGVVTSGALVDGSALVLAADRGGR
jgi:acetyl-CoA acetyltransferase